jgi:hypothetical protein
VFKFEIKTISKTPCLFLLEKMSCVFLTIFNKKGILTKPKREFLNKKGIQIDKWPEIKNKPSKKKTK